MKNQLPIDLSSPWLRPLVVITGVVLLLPLGDSNANALASAVFYLATAFKNSIEML